MDVCMCGSVLDVCAGGACPEEAGSESIHSTSSSSSSSPEDLPAPAVHPLLSVSTSAWSSYSTGAPAVQKDDSNTSCTHQALDM